MFTKEEYNTLLKWYGHVRSKGMTTLNDYYLAEKIKAVVASEFPSEVKEPPKEEKPKEPCTTHIWLAYDTLYDGKGHPVTMFRCTECGEEDEEWEDEEESN